LPSSTSSYPLTTWEPLGIIFSLSHLSPLTLPQGRPSGTGKTSVSSSIIRDGYKEGLPIMIVCASNQAFDVVAGRFADRFKDRSSTLEQAYHLGTEFAECTDIVTEGGTFRDTR
jgi:hypothetical protein